MTDVLLTVQSLTIENSKPIKQLEGIVVEELKIIQEPKDSLVDVELKAGVPLLK